MRRWAFPAFAIGAAAAACASSDTYRPLHLATNLTFPQGVLTNVTAITVTVYEGESCDEATGVTAPIADTTAPNGPGFQVTTATLKTDGCGDGVAFCGDVEIDQSSEERVFAAAATDADSKTLAVGCVSQVVNSSALSLSITMVGSSSTPAVCGDGTVELTEQCEPPSTKTCDASCHSIEVLLSTGSGSNGPTTAGAKSTPFFLWPSGDDPGGRFFAFYTDTVPNASPSDLDISLRVMSSTLDPVTTPTALAGGAIFMPHDTSGTFPPAADPRQQQSPSAAFAGGKYYVVFQDDTGTANGQDIHMIAFDSALAVDANAPSAINGAGGEANIQARPVVAANGKGALFIAWEDQAAKTINGRVYDPAGGGLGTQNTLSIGQGNSHVSLDAIGDGWVAVWQSDSNIVYRLLDASGTPQGTPQPVSSGPSAILPSVAGLPDGRFAVAWAASTTDIVVQRYDAKHAVVPGDQNKSFNDKVTAGQQTSPFIASTPAAGGSYVAAWSDLGSGHIQARAMGGSGGFLKNPVDGTESEFQASLGDKRARSSPVVVAGGKGPYLAIGWSDTTTGGSGNGIVARRFPLPQP